jgi:transcription initiation factor TFIIB
VLLKNNFETAISGMDGRTGMSANLQRAQFRANAQSHAAGKTSNAVLSSIFAKITEKCEGLQLPKNVITRAQHVYQIADAQRAVKGKKEATIIAACIIYASRDAGASRTMSEIGQALKVTKKELGQVFILVKSAVQRERGGNGSMEAVSGPSTSMDSIEALIARYCNLLDIDNTVQNAARHVANLAMSKAPIDGRNPASIAAAVLYFTCILFERKTTAREISDIANMGESTIKLWVYSTLAVYELMIAYVS